MASDREDILRAEQAQRHVREEVHRCQEIVQNGRQLFMLAQALPRTMQRDEPQ